MVIHRVSQTNPIIALRKHVPWWCPLRLLPYLAAPACYHVAPSYLAVSLLLLVLNRSFFFYTRSLLHFILGRSFLSCSVAPSSILGCSFPSYSVAPSHLHSRKSSMVSIRRYLHLLPPQIPHATSLFYLPFTHCCALVAITSILNHSFCSYTSYRPSILLYYTQASSVSDSSRDTCHYCPCPWSFLICNSWVSPT